MTWRIADDLDLSIARTEAAALVGTHDFAAFRSSADERTSTRRTISAVAVRESDRDGRLVHIDVHGDGFLHNMVRIIAGTLVDVARHRLEPGAIARALVSMKRSDLGIT
ncbi:MAG: tRNA pseudouridine(38-40) synthase TruA, partial [Rubrivivax sp.]|nr:tRNA pseudouridine(38-40) synthase TruA [Rubrivivax sp.]